MNYGWTRRRDNSFWVPSKAIEIEVSSSSTSMMLLTHTAPKMLKSLRKVSAITVMHVDRAWGAYHYIKASIACPQSYDMINPLGVDVRGSQWEWWKDSGIGAGTLMFIRKETSDNQWQNTIFFPGHYINIVLGAFLSLWFTRFFYVAAVWDPNISCEMWVTFSQ